MDGTSFWSISVRCISWFVAGMVLLAGCEGQKPPPVALPKVIVTRPIVRDVVDAMEFTGRTEPIESVEIRARVEGFLKSIHFEDGATVDEGDLLFVIDKKPFEADVRAARAKLAQGTAARNLAKANLDRAEKLVPSGAITVQEYQTRAAQLEVAEAAILADEAAVEQSEIRLGYTDVSAPFAGLAGEHLVDAGNLVGAAERTLLTTIVQSDPIYVYFDVSEQVVLRYLRRKLEDPALADPDDERGKAYVALADETEFVHEGKIEFLDNRVDTATGTAIIRGTFPNPDGLLYPGLFVRIRVPLEPEENAILVEEQAVGTDLGGKYLLIVGDGDVVQQRHVELGMQMGQMRVVRKNLRPEERYIIAGLQRARPGLPVEVEMAPVSTASEPPTEASVEGEGAREGASDSSAE